MHWYSVREIQNIGRYRKLNKNVIREAHIHFQKKKKQFEALEIEQLIWHANLVIVWAKNAPVACIVATWCPN